MDRTRLLIGAAAVAIATGACSAPVVQPESRGLEESNERVFTRFASGTRATDRLATGLLVTSDGREWVAASAGDADLGRLAVALQNEGQTQECDNAGTCFRISSPAGGIKVDQSTNAGASWTQVWSISAGRLDFQDRCCGSRPFVLDDLEYVPSSGVVAVSLGRYGLLTRDVDGVWHLETLGRPDRPESGLMVGLYVEPLVLAAIGLIIGWVTTEILLSRLRRDVMDANPSDHDWITGRARMAPILLPVLFLGTVLIVGALAFRLSATVEADPATARGWLALALSAVLITGTVVVGHRILARQWASTDGVKDSGLFEDARRTVFRAEATGTTATVAATLAALLPLVAWTTGAIDVFGDALVASGALIVLSAGAFWGWAGFAPLDRRTAGSGDGHTPILEADVGYENHTSID